MNSDAALILEIWELVREGLPPARRNDVALGILKAFEEYGFDHSALAEAGEEDTTLGKAFKEGIREEWEADESDDELDADW